MGSPFVGGRQAGAVCWGTNACCRLARCSICRKQAADCVEARTESRLQTQAQIAQQETGSHEPRACCLRFISTSCISGGAAARAQHTTPPGAPQLPPPQARPRPGMHQRGPATRRLHATVPTAAAAAG